MKGSALFYILENAIRLIRISGHWPIFVFCWTCLGTLECRRGQQDVLWKERVAAFSVDRTWAVEETWWPDVELNVLLHSSAKVLCFKIVPVQVLNRCSFFRINRRVAWQALVVSRWIWLVSRWPKWRHRRTWRHRQTWDNPPPPFPIRLHVNVWPHQTPKKIAGSWKKIQRN